MKDYRDDKRDFASSEDMVRKITNPRNGIYIIGILAVFLLARHFSGNNAQQEQTGHEDVISQAQTSESAELPTKELLSEELPSEEAASEETRQEELPTEGVALGEAQLKELISEEIPSEAQPEVAMVGVADYPAMVKVAGKLYYDSGEISEEPRCGMMDGKITSMTEGEPAEDDQSNFGTDYGYQCGPDTIDVCIDDSWHIFIPFEAEHTVDWDSLTEQEKMEIDPMYHGEGPHVEHTQTEHK